MAEIDPLWFLCPSDRLADRTWSVDEFFRSGRHHIARDLATIREIGIPLARGSALDFGCGVGRQTQALAAEFETCVGVDISPRMIELATGFNRFGDRCRYVVNCRDDLRVFGDSMFDLVYSNNALLHVSPDLIGKYLLELVRVLESPGVLMFQLPVASLLADATGPYLTSLPRCHPRRVLNKLRGLTIGHDASARYARLRRLGLSGQWIHRTFGFAPRVTVNFLDEAAVAATLTAAGMTIAHVDTYTFKDRRDAIFVARKG